MQTINKIFTYQYYVVKVAWLSGLIVLVIMLTVTEQSEFRTTIRFSLIINELLITVLILPSWILYRMRFNTKIDKAFFIVLMMIILGLGIFIRNDFHNYSLWFDTPIKVNGVVLNVEKEGPFTFRTKTQFYKKQIGFKSRLYTDSFSIATSPHTNSIKFENDFTLLQSFIGKNVTFTIYRRSNKLAYISDGRVTFNNFKKEFSPDINLPQ